MNKSTERHPRVPNCSPSLFPTIANHGKLYRLQLGLAACIKVDGTSFQVFWICKLWKERTKNQPNTTTKFVYDSIAKFVLDQKRQLFRHQLLPWQRYLMIFQTYFWASNAYILKTNLVTPNFFHISFFVIWKWNYMIIWKNFYVADFL